MLNVFGINILSCSSVWCICWVLFCKEHSTATNIFMSSFSLSPNPSPNTHSQLLSTRITLQLCLSRTHIHFFLHFWEENIWHEKNDYHNDLLKSPQSIKRIPSKKETCSLFLWMVITYSVKNTTGITFPWMFWNQNLLDDMGAGDSLGFLPLKYSDILPTLSSLLYFSSNYEPIRWTFCKSSREM